MGAGKAGGKSTGKCSKGKDGKNASGAKGAQTANEGRERRLCGKKGHFEEGLLVGGLDL